MTATELHAAFVESSVTPEPGCPLTGFIARTEPSRDVHDDLFARLLMLQHGGKRIGIITVDMLGTDIATATDLRRKVAAILQTPPACVLLNASHTHAGPATIGLEGIAPLHTEFLEAFEAALCDLAREAMVSFEPARIVHRRGAAPHVGLVRRWPGQQPAPYPLDDTLDVLTIERAGGPPALGLTVTLPCHAVAAGTTLSISADFPGAMVCKLTEGRPGQVIAFAQGCAGDINPAAGVVDHDAAEVTGIRLAEAVRTTLAQAEPTTIDSGPVRAATTQVRLPFGDPPPRDELLALEEESTQPDADAADLAMGTFARKTLALLDANDLPDGVDVPVQVLAIGDDPCLRIVGLPGECFTTLGRAVREACPHPTIVLGYTNGLMGYVADRASHEDGGYEIHSAHRYYCHPAPYAAGAGEDLVDAAINLVRSLG